MIRGESLISLMKQLVTHDPPSSLPKKVVSLITQMPKICQDEILLMSRLLDLDPKNLLMASRKVVTPVKTGVHRFCNSLKTLDSGFRRNDGKT